MSGQSPTSLNPANRSLAVEQKTPGACSKAALPHNRLQCKLSQQASEVLVEAFGASHPFSLILSLPLGELPKSSHSSSLSEQDPPASRPLKFPFPKQGLRLSTRTAWLLHLRLQLHEG